jgi:hypothetical protein
MGGVLNSLDAWNALWLDFSMQTLGLASEIKPTDGMFKRLFWPTIENQYDLDLVSVQGFWVCVIVGVLSCVLLLATGQLLVGFLIAATYLLGATGVRQRSIAAAILIFLCYSTDRIGGIFMGQPNFGVIPIVSLLLLFANVRATVLARRWRSSGTPEHTEAPELSHESVTDKLANGMPARVWPIGRFVFFPLAGILLLLTVVGVAMYPRAHRKQLELQKQRQEGDAITVEPT